MNAYGILFGALHLKKDEIEGRSIIEVGAQDINGSLRPLIHSYKPKSYIGVDIAMGPGVDRICDAGDLVSQFGLNAFDVVICTEVIEHIRQWRSAVCNLKRICRSNGIVLLTTRSRGMGYHGFPNDYWRYEVQDIERIFSDFRIKAIQKDPQKGVFIKAVKPKEFVENDLSDISLYSIIFKKRLLNLHDELPDSMVYRRLVIREAIRKFLYRTAHFLESRF